MARQLAPSGSQQQQQQQHSQQHSQRSRSSSRSRSRQEPRSSQASSGSSGRESDASSSSGSQIVPMVVPSGAPLRVRRNSKGINVVHINGVMVGVGKFINVGTVPGVIRYIGPTLFAPGLWIGVELTERKGKHNGTVQNVQYFECAADHGIFIRAERLDVK
ncbi:hypothetical protein ATCC90586_008023 [Pythium insidiosum]|nr:hypothetical protein ATCC90586_008023 [Pythium insidiosum]